ncbi:complex I NDUFA9 subunit family protein [Phaeovibrio sulfidiphilus]|uniref:Complex I NDUFA9 subunit family protein n=1 Tax=Phaeovibrio sulfidiphilus TaxID=1220600 RepID=A0A8J6YL12_9PROT|nr:complex I NDUFA9 subunit family protein [Phaeovibrio sulfidiphilus]MBE1236610.1 complex I NDUFA9 subunit family protein [Phaeovibrio sulfidiphilus]
MELRGRTVTVFGGAGFIGSVLVGLLARRGARVRVPVRDMVKGAHLRPLGEPGQVSPLLCSTGNADSVARVIAGSDVVINLIGILFEGGGHGFESVHVDTAGRIAREAKKADVPVFVHFSALGADDRSASVYARTKSRGEAAVRTAFPSATIVRPSVVFGPGDSFLENMASLARTVPVIGYVDRGGEAGPTRIQPVYVGDVGRAVVRILETPALHGRTFELGGDRVMTMKEIGQLVARSMNRSYPVVGISMGMARILATLVGWLPRPLLTRDVVRLLETDNVVQGKLPGLAELGIEPQPIEMICATMMRGYRPLAPGIVLRRER